MASTQPPLRLNLRPVIYTRTWKKLLPISSLNCRSKSQRSVIGTTTALCRAQDCQLLNFHFVRLSMSRPPHFRSQYLFLLRYFQLLHYWEVHKHRREMTKDLDMRDSSSHDLFTLCTTLKYGGNNVPRAVIIRNFF